VQVDNHTGVELLCCFDHGNAKQDGSIGSWESGAFLIRYIQNTHLPACLPAQQFVHFSLHFWHSQMGSTKAQKLCCAKEFCTAVYSVIWTGTQNHEGT
jgi:hypothetical protein